MSSSMSNIEVAFVYVWDVFMMYCRRNVLNGALMEQNTLICWEANRTVLVLSKSQWSE